MVEITASCERRSGVTLVRATVKNTRRTAQVVRLRSTLDGPTWPPRRRGVTVPEWTDETWEGVVEPDQCRGLGFATPAPPADRRSESTSPVEVVAVERASDEHRHRARDVLAELEEWSPPSEVFSGSR